MLVLKLTDELINGSIKNKRKKIIVLFFDIRNFTKMTQNYSPDNLLSNILNPYFAIIESHIIDAGGYIDKFIGDSVLACFGINEDLHTKDFNRIYHVVEEINYEIKNKIDKNELPKDFKHGIGINYGECLIGIVGGEVRHSLSVIGDTVNIASKICNLANKEGRDNILYSKSFYNSLATDIKDNMYSFIHKLLKYNIILNIYEKRRQ